LPKPILTENKRYSSDNENLAIVSAIQLVEDLEHNDSLIRNEQSFRAHMNSPVSPGLQIKYDTYPNHEVDSRNLDVQAGK